MTTFITLFVAIQLFCGFCALLAAMHESQGGHIGKPALQRVRVRRD